MITATQKTGARQSSSRGFSNPRQHLMVQAIRIALALGATAAVLPAHAASFTCPVSSDQTIGTALTNSATCDVQNHNIAISSSGSLNNLPRGSFSNLGNLTNAGSLYLSGLYGTGPTLTILSKTTLTNTSTGQLSNVGTLYNYSGGTLSNEGTLNNNYGGTLSNSGTLNNVGTLFNAGTLNNQTNGTLSNVGTLNNFSGTLSNSGMLNNNSGGTLNNISGTLSNSGMLNNNSGGTLNNNNYGTLTNYVTLNNNSGGTLNNYSGSWLNNNHGSTLNNNFGSLLMNYGNFSNAGALNVTGGVYGSGAYVQTVGGTTTVSGSMSQATIDIKAGTLQGAGTISTTQGMKIEAGAIISPGNQPNTTGTLNVTGGLQVNGELSMLVNGTSAGQYDVLKVNGNVGFGSGSLLSVNFSPFAYSAGTIWDLLLSTSFSGLGNETVNVTGLQPNSYSVKWVKIASGLDAFELMVTTPFTPVVTTPIPAAFWLAFSGIAMLGLFVKRGGGEA